MASLMKNPNEMGLWEAAKHGWLKRNGLLDAYNQQQGRQQALELVGKKATPYELDESQKFDSTDSAHQAILNGLPNDVSPEIKEQSLKGFQNEGTGLLGGKLNPVEFYGGLLATQGYENIGNQGLMNINQGAMVNQAKLDEDRLKQEKIVRDNYQKNLGGFGAVQDAYMGARAALSGKSGMDMVAAVVQFMKTLDPTSVVREGEYAQVTAASGLSSQMLTTINNALKGEGLTIKARNDMAKTLHNLYGQRFNKARKQYGQYETLTKNGGLNSQNTLMGLGLNMNELNALEFSDPRTNTPVKPKPRNLTPYKGY